jgi:hypothetical protein
MQAASQLLQKELVMVRMVVWVGVKVMRRLLQQSRRRTQKKRRGMQ